ncbi:LarC family nickel insertion protein [Parasphaerochaeta coccoides]|uniref:LarC family nickel insertion protein n=1 Tax=Parasphaerochaeta coccoides (strain ATCC BAA-1237 / DSM 17374 / SPN1) TaxID=760011 RepID=F4GIC1_PARC1|nr:LarC family nickel insertion protein [Parasphaerochaeta coccoides]AEC01629.1 protein of unknown function DUF111 [Parasphaerochaeta coccoides DSM 17374]
MKTIYIDCSMGVAGDMLMSALLELVPNPHVFLEAINGLGIPGMYVSCKKLSRHGSEGTHTEVLWNGQTEESDNAVFERKEDFQDETGGFAKIEHIIASLTLPHGIKKNARAILHMIVEAESRVHGMAIQDIHDSRLGTMDAVIDVLGCCILMEELNPDRIFSSSIRTGYGENQWGGKILPVPAPATAHLLHGIPFYSGDTRGEFCTPTGVALIKYFTDDFRPMGNMSVTKTGCGMGSRDFGIPGGLRVHYGHSEDTSGGSTS